MGYLTASRIADLAAAISCSPPSQLAEKLMRKIGRPPPAPGPELLILRDPGPEARRALAPAIPAKAFAPEARRETAKMGTHRRRVPEIAMVWKKVEGGLPSERSEGLCDQIWAPQPVHFSWSRLIILGHSHRGNPPSAEPEFSLERRGKEGRQHERGHFHCDGAVRHLCG